MNYSLSQIAAAVLSGASNSAPQTPRLSVPAARLFKNLFLLSGAPDDLRKITVLQLEKLRINDKSNKEKVMKAFDILNQKKILADEEFRQLRRAVGNANYNKTMELLKDFFNRHDGDQKTRIYLAAAILGTLKGAAVPYTRNFKYL